MGFIKKLFKRDLTPEQQEEKSRKEKEWMERNWQRGYRFAEKIGLRDKIDKIDKWGTKYPKTFFGIIFACLFLSIILNHCAAMKSDSVEFEKHRRYGIHSTTRYTVGSGNHTDV